jgi:hypothetical protein
MLSYQHHTSVFEYDWLFDYFTTLYQSLKLDNKGYGRMASEGVREELFI